MMTQTPLISLSERIYRALLILYPADYRLEYGALMVQIFRDVSRDAYRSQGAVGLAFWWCATLLDLTRTVIEQRREVTMNKSILIQWTGILLIVGGIFATFTSISQLQPGSHYTYRGIYQISILMLTPAYLLIGIGNFGLVLRYGAAAGALGRVALIASGIGAVLMAVGLVLTNSVREEFWMLAMLGLYTHTIAMIFFGLLHLRNRIMPVFRALPLVIGLLPGLMIFGIFRISGYSNADYGAFVYLIGIGMTWVIMGIAIQKDLMRPVAVAAP